MWEAGIVDINWIGIASLVIGFIVALFMKTGISAINGIISSMVCYLVLYYVLKVSKSATALH